MPMILCKNYTNWYEKGLNYINIGLHEGYKVGTDFRIRFMFWNTQNISTLFN